MMRSLPGLAAAFMIVGAPASAEPATPADARAIAALEQRWHGDADAVWMQDMLDEDFARPMASGAVWSKADQVNWIRSRPPGGGFSHRTETPGLRIVGDVAVVTGVNVLISPAGAEVDRNVFTNVYVRRAGGWRLFSAQRTQVAQPSAPPG